MSSRARLGANSNAWRSAWRDISRVEVLAGDPRPRGCVKLQGAAALWRIRVGDYRVIYSVDDDARLVDVRVDDTEAMLTSNGTHAPNHGMQTTAVGRS